MQQRDVGSELIVAIAAVAVLAFALVFGILLTLSSNPNRTEDTPVSTIVIAAVQAMTATTPPTLSVTNTVSSTTVPPTLTSSATATHITPTATSSATLTPTRAASTIPTALQPATTRMVAAPTDTPRPLASVASSRTSSVTAAPTVTFTQTLTYTVTASATFTRTFTPSATFTHTATRTMTFTPTFTRTFTPLPTETSGIRPTPRFTRTPSASPTLPECVRPTGWTVYIVQPDNTLFSIARAVESSVRELSRVNCLSDASFIVTGDALFVPTLPVEPVRTGVRPTGEPPAYAALGCTDRSTAAISNLTSGQRVRGAVTLRGTAYLDSFSYYKIEVRPDAATEFNFYTRSETRVQNGDLGVLDTSIFGKGLHWIRLVVVDAGAAVPPSAVCVVPVLFE